ncbi:MAG: hypothetical protein ACO1SV_04450 [Fimbriimonas sp.]
MIPLLALIAVDGLKKGEAWAFERTYRYVNEAEAIDLSDIERTDVLVSETRPNGYDLSLSRRLIATKVGEARVPAPEGQTPWAKTLKFGTNGQAKNPPEDVAHPIRARIDRMLWTASENRQGLGWSRAWPQNDGVPGGKATVKPGKEGSLAITYTDATGVKAEGTAKLDPKRPVIVEMSITINRTFLPGGEVPVSVVVKQLPAG